MQNRADGPVAECIALHPTKSLTRDLLVFMDSMSRETLMRETLVSHLAVQGFVVKAPRALLKEKVEFELPNDLVVKPVDRVELIVFIKALRKSVIIYPFVLESATEWLIIGGVDMVRYGLLSELNSKLTSLYSTGPLIDIDSTPVHHLAPSTAIPLQGAVIIGRDGGNRNIADAVESAESAGRGNPSNSNREEQSPLCSGST
jgi:hypothetical protein